MKALALAVCKRDPILLEGVTGSGKTVLLEELARVTGHDTLLKIHLGDQTDAKVLLGTYVCTEIPGEFKWVPGILTRAVSEGMWIVIEDINLAPVEVLSVLLPLLEKRELFIPGRGELIKAKDTFQLFATQTLYGNKNYHRDTSLLSNFWTRVIVEPLSFEELQKVLEKKYSHISPLVPKFLSTFHVLQQSQRTVFQTDQKEESQEVLANIPVVHSKNSFGPTVMKWCDRCLKLLKNIQLKTDFISTQVKEAAFLEAIDCFCGALPQQQQRGQLAQLIAQCWDISTERVNYYSERYKPNITQDDSNLTVGRVTLPINKTLALNLEKNTSVFAYTRHSATLMEKIGQCVQAKEPVILVGETGCGKIKIGLYSQHSK